MYMRMPWGKHKGKPINEIPESYLWWALRNATALDPDQRKAIETFLGVGEAATGKTNGQADIDLRAVLKTWYAGLARDYHPDRSRYGDEAMKIVNECHDRLRKLLHL
jgi:hypothetical protein